MPEITVQEKRSVLEVRIDGELFAYYNFDPAAQGLHKPFFHPIIGPSGLSVTQNGEYPGTLCGHYWHRGLMIGHQKVNAVSFWEERDTCGRILHRGFDEIESGGETGSFAERLAWVGPNGVLVLTESRRVTFAIDGETRILDARLTLRAADEDVRFDATSYGLFVAKAAARLHVGDHDQTEGERIARLANLGHHQQGGTITMANGERNTRYTTQSGNTTNAEWADYSGPPDANEGYAIFDHPSNPRHPTGWLNWNNMTIGPSPTFTEALRLPKGDSLQFAYRFLVHPGDVVSGGVAEQYARYAQTTV